jgi:TctA family transporter
MKRQRWKFLKYVPIVLAVIVSIALIWLDNRNADNGQWGCLTMLVAGCWGFAVFVTSGD